MRKSITVTQKKRGRPATGFDPLVTTRLPEKMIADIKAWASQNRTSRSDAIRQLIAVGLAAAPLPLRTKGKSA
jgi:ribbon-helix-helix CopG family protein